MTGVFQTTENLVLAETQKVQAWYLQLRRKYDEPKAGDYDYIQLHLAGVGI